MGKVVRTEPPCGPQSSRPQVVPHRILCGRYCPLSCILLLDKPTAHDQGSATKRVGAIAREDPAAGGGGRGWSKRPVQGVTTWRGVCVFLIGYRVSSLA
jgi:hypothetical protein